MAKNSDDHIRVGTVKTVSVQSLRQHPENVRLHGNRNIDDIKGSLREFGQRRPLLVAKDQTTVVAGNGTLQAAIALGWSSVSVQLTDLEGDVALAYAIADNRTAETSEWNDEALADQLRRFMEDGKQHLAEATGWNSDELAARFGVFAGEESTVGWDDALNGLPEGERQPIQQMTFTLHDTQVDLVKRAIKTAKDAGEFPDTGNENSNGNALSRIAEAYLER